MRKLMKSLQPWRRRGRAVAGFFPLSALGVLVLAASAWALWVYGIGHKDFVLFMLGLAGISVTLAIAALVIVLAVILHRRLRPHARPEPLVLEVDSWMPSGVELRFPTWIPCIHVDWTWDEHPSEIAVEGCRGILSERVCPRRRGLLSGVRRRVRVADFLGLTAVSWGVDDAVPVQILPPQGRMDRQTVLRSLSSGDDFSDPSGEPVGERVDMRQYAQGDSPRMILWKVYARSRRLMVRVPERALSMRPRACLYLVAGDDHDEAAASLARAIIQHDLLGPEWRFGADGCDAATSARLTAIEHICRSAAVDSDALPGARLRGFLNEAERDGYGFCLVLLPPLAPSGLGAVVEALSSTRLKIASCVGVRELPEAADRPAWQRFLVAAPVQGSPAARRNLRAMGLAWAEMGRELWVSDVVSGALFHDLDAALAPSRGSQKAGATR